MIEIYYLLRTLAMIAITDGDGFVCSFYFERFDVCRDGPVIVSYDALINYFESLRPYIRYRNNNTVKFKIELSR